MSSNAHEPAFDSACGRSNELNSGGERQHIGEHLLLECYGPIAQATARQLEDLMRAAATAGGATVLFAHMHPFGDQPVPDTACGITGVLLLAESHISVHTWPEVGYAAFDIFMCGACNPKTAAKLIADSCQHSKVNIRSVLRGSSANHNGASSVEDGLKARRFTAASDAAVTSPARNKRG